MDSNNPPPSNGTTTEESAQRIYAKLVDPALQTEAAGQFHRFGDSLATEQFQPELLLAVAALASQGLREHTAPSPEKTAIVNGVDKIILALAGKSQSAAPEDLQKIDSVLNKLSPRTLARNITALQRNLQNPDTDTKKLAAQLSKLTGILEQAAKSTDGKTAKAAQEVLDSLKAPLSAQASPTAKPTHAEAVIPKPIEATSIAPNDVLTSIEDSNLHINF